MIALAVVLLNVYPCISNTISFPSAIVIDSALSFNTLIVVLSLVVIAFNAFTTVVKYSSPIAAAYVELTHFAYNFV